MANDTNLKSVYFPEIPSTDPLNNGESPRIDGKEILPGTVPWNRMWLGPINVTNQIIKGTTAEDPSVISTGGPNTKGLIVRGNNYNNPVNFWVAVGQGTNSLAYSYNGIDWVGIGTSIFSTAGLCVAFNGTMFVAGGQGTNTLAYSTNGISWTGIGTAIFSSRCTAIAWNGTMWVAGGTGTNTLAYSTDGINWTGEGTSILTGGCNSLCWNGTLWVAGGADSGSFTIFSSTNGTSWTGRLSSTTITNVWAIAWNGTKFLAGGIGGTLTLVQSTNGTSWTTASTDLSLVTKCLVWNGTRWNQGGTGNASHSFAYSTNGTNWTGLGVTIFANTYGAAWNGIFVVLVGQGGTSCIAYSSDGITFTSASSSIFTTQGNGVCSAPAPQLVPTRDSFLTSGVDQAANLQEWQDADEVVLASVSATGVFTIPGLTSTGAITATTINMSGQLTNTLAIGTAPFVITSTTKVTNLNADLLDDQTGSYYLDSANFTGTNWTDLTDAGDSTLHYHATDRDSANFTGTNWTDLTDGGATTLHSHAGGGAHDILSATHSDSTAAAVVRGDIVTGQGATPKWTRLAKGSAGAFLTGDGTDVAWSTGFLAITATKTLTVTLDASVTGSNTGDQDLSGYLLKSTYDANTILIATADNTPVALTIGASTIVGRKSSGDIVALTATEARTILNVADGATAVTKATAAELDTGTDDAKFATALAIAGRAEKDGWTPARESWSYASASTITVPSGAASKYAVGDRIKWTQTTVRYGVIVAVADTVLTIAVNTDYVVDNAAISANFYSHQATPVGYPQWFSYTPTVTLPTGATGSNTLQFAKYKIIGRQVTVLLDYTAGTIGGTITGTYMSYTFPIDPAVTTYGANAFGAGQIVIGALRVASMWIIDNTDIYIQKYDGGAFTSWSGAFSGGIIFNI